MLAVFDIFAQNLFGREQIENRISMMVENLPWIK